MPGLIEGAYTGEIETVSGAGVEPEFNYQLIGKIYEAGTAPALWTDVLSDLALLLQSPRAMLICHDQSNGVSRIREAHNVDSDFWPLYVDQLGRENPWYGRPSFAESADRVLIGDDILNGAELRTTKFYKEFLEPLGLAHTLHATIATSGSRQLNLLIGRPDSMGPYSAVDVDLLQPMVGHLQRAWKIHNSNAEQGFVEQATVEALNLLSVGIFMVDEKGKVLSMNASGQAIIDQADGLRIGHVGLEASETGKLVTPQGLLDSLDRRDTDEIPPVKASAVSRPSGRRPYSLLVCPFAGTADSFDESKKRAALVFVSDPDDATSHYSADFLRDVYKLTPAEARVALMVGQGHRVLDIAEQLTISVHTARTHLKRVFEKTGVERQAELVQLVCGSLSLFRRDVDCDKLVAL